MMMWKSLFTGILILSFAIIHNDSTAQIVDFPDTLRMDTAQQELKMIIEKKDTTIFVPVDSIKGDFGVRKFDPQKTWWLSAIIPGLGQAFNKKYWKIPIIYTIFAGTMYMIDDNGFKYKIYRDAYKVFDTEGPPAWSPTMTSTQLKDRKDFYKRNRDLSIILGVVFYGMNILDAKVDADLMDFDVGDDLSLHVEPHIETVENISQNVFGLKFVLSLNVKD